MKIICDSCGAKYSIADEKVQGKVFKIRCKKCSEVIVVEGADDAADAGAAQGDYGGAYDAQDAAEWYVVIDGERVGPITREEVEGYFSSGQLHAESYVWKDGMDDWVMLETLDAFAGLVDDAAGPNDQTIVADQSGRPVSAAEAHVGGQQDSGVQSSHSGGDQGADSGGYQADVDYAEGGGGDATAVMDPERFKQDNFEEDFEMGGAQAEVERTGESGKYAAVESGSYEQQSDNDYGGYDSAVGESAGGDEDYDSDQGGMFAAFDSEESAGGYDEPDDGGLGAAESASPDLSGGNDDLVGARNENSVLFSLSSVDDEPSSGQSTGGQPGQAQGNDKSGLIDIQSLASSHAAMEGGGGDESGDDEEFVANTMSMPALAPSGSQKSNNALVIGVSVAAAVLAAVVAAGGMYFFFVMEQEEEPAPQQGATAEAEGADDQDDDADGDDEVDEDERSAEEAAQAVRGDDDEEDADEEDADEDEDERAEADDEDDEDDEEAAVAEADTSTGSSGSTTGSSSSSGSTTGSSSSTTGSSGSGTSTTGSSSGTTGTTTSSTDDDDDDDDGGIASRLDQAEDDDEDEAEDLPDSLSRSMVRNTVNRYTGRINDCAENSNPDGLSGHANVSFEVAGSGSVTSANAQGEFAGTEVGSCIEGVVRSMQFPATQQGEPNITYPFSVR